MNEMGGNEKRCKSRYVPVQLIYMSAVLRVPYLAVAF